MRGGCTVDCGLHSPASRVSACTISPLFGVQANTCKVHLKETAKINPNAKKEKSIQNHSNHSPGIGHRASAEPCPPLGSLTIRGDHRSIAPRSSVQSPTAIAGSSGPL